MLGAAEGSSGPVTVLLKSFGIGAGIGIAAGLVWLLFLRALKDARHAYPFTLSALLILYVIIDHSGGSAAFGILAVALILGNARLIGRAIGLSQDVELDMSVRGFHAQMAFIIKSFFFVFIGAMLGPPWGGVLLGILLGISLLILRVPAVNLALIGSGIQGPDRGLVHVSMPRGMAAGVLATLPITSGVPGTEPFPVMVFTAVFVTILIFAVGFPLAKGRSQRAAAAALVPLSEPQGSAHDPHPVVHHDSIPPLGNAPAPNEGPEQQ
jgi:cell volume regulation protein A